MNWEDRIVSNPMIMHGQPCVSGTRIPATIVLANLAAGLSVEDIIRSYPSLTAEDVQAALAYAAERMKDERVLPLPA
jgi:uncharacterized protein (DUF433 family)